MSVFGAVTTAAKSAVSVPFWKKLAAFVLSVFGGVPAEIDFNVGTGQVDFNISDTVNIFGTETVVTMTGKDNIITLTTNPQ